MLIMKKGNLLDARVDIICHQCNTEGIFGGGLAAEIKNKYPECELSAIEHVKVCKDSRQDLLGTYDLFIKNIWSKDGYIVANCFTQDKNFDTNYIALYQVFNHLLHMCKVNSLTIAIPFKYGCGIANGEWNIVSAIIDELSNIYGVAVEVYELEVS